MATGPLHPAWPLRIERLRLHTPWFLKHPDKDFGAGVFLHRTLADALDDIPRRNLNNPWLKIVLNLRYRGDDNEWKLTRLLPLLKLLRLLLNLVILKKLEVMLIKLDQELRTHRQLILALTML